MHDRVVKNSSISTVAFADDTVVIGRVTNNDEKAYWEEVGNQSLWCNAKMLLLNY